MDYKNKYLKYKKKYILKKDTLNINQYGSSLTSHTKLDRRVLENISTGENPLEREERVKNGLNPENGYRIMENKDEILSYNNNIESLKKYGRQDIINKKINNINHLYGDIFNIFNNGLGIPLYLIDSRGDGNCFLNSLYIFTILSKKTDKVNDLYSTTMIKLSNPVNFNDFKLGLYFLADNLLDSRISILGEDLINQYKLELRNENVPDVDNLATVYSNFFKCKILILQINDNYEIRNCRSIEPEEDVLSKSKEPKEPYDCVVIFQKNDVHFNLLIPLTNEREHRILLYNILYDRFRIGK
jgi:hypothetical protein